MANVMNDLPISSLADAGTFKMEHSASLLHLGTEHCLSKYMEVVQAIQYRLWGTDIECGFCTVAKDPLWAVSKG